MAKRKLKDLNLIDGQAEKVDESGEKFVPSTLDQLWGDTGDGRYNTVDYDEYKNQLDEMNTSDLRAHASRLGILPVTSRERLSKRLLTEFTKHFNNYRKPANENLANSLKKTPKAVLDILAEAK